jgi:hypothetical protein
MSFLIRSGNEQPYRASETPYAFDFDVGERFIAETASVCAGCAADGGQI